MEVKGAVTEHFNLSEKLKCEVLGIHMDAVTILKNL